PYATAGGHQPKRRRLLDRRRRGAEIVAGDALQRDAALVKIDAERETQRLHADEIDLLREQPARVIFAETGGRDQRLGFKSQRVGFESRFRNKHPVQSRRSTPNSRFTPRKPMVLPVKRNDCWKRIASLEPACAAAGETVPAISYIRCWNIRTTALVWLPSRPAILSWCPNTACTRAGNSTFTAPLRFSASSAALIMAASLSGRLVKSAITSR